MSDLLPYGYDLLYDIKTEEQLNAYVESLVRDLVSIAAMRREDGKPIDAYLRQKLLSILVDTATPVSEQHFPHNEE